MRECPKCGTDVPPGKILCPNCDHLLDDTIEKGKKAPEPVRTPSVPPKEYPVSAPPPPLSPTPEPPVSYEVSHQPVEVKARAKGAPPSKTLPGQGIGIIGFKGVGKTVFTISMLRALEKHGYTAVIEPPEGEEHIHKIIDEIVEHERLPKTTEGFTKFNVKFKLRKYMGLYKDAFDVNISDAQGEIMRYMAENSYPFEEVRRQAEDFFAFLRKCKALICIVNLSTLIPPEGTIEPGHFFDLNMLYKRLFTSMKRNNVKVDRVALAFSAADMFNRDAPRVKKQIEQMALQIGRIEDEDERQERLQNLKTMVVRERVLPQAAFDIIVREEFFESLQFLSAENVKFSYYKVFPLGKKVEKFPPESLAPECSNLNHTCGNCIRVRYRRLIPKNVVEPLFWCLNRSEAPLKNIFLNFPLKKIALCSVLICLLGWGARLGYNFQIKPLSIYESNESHYSRIEKLERLKRSSFLYEMAIKYHDPFTLKINKLSEEKLKEIYLEIAGISEGSSGRIDAQTKKRLEAILTKLREYNSNINNIQFQNTANTYIGDVEEMIKKGKRGPVKPFDPAAAIKESINEIGQALSEKKFDLAWDKFENLEKQATDSTTIDDVKSEIEKAQKDAEKRVKELESEWLEGKKIVEKMVDDKDFDGALSKVKLLAIEHDHEKTDGLRRWIIETKEKQVSEAKKEIEKLAALAQDAFKGKNYSGAENFADQILNIDKYNSFANKLKKDIADARKSEQIENLLTQANNAYNTEKYKKARDLIDQINTLDSGNDDAKGLLGKIGKIEGLLIDVERDIVKANSNDNLGKLISAKKKVEEIKKLNGSSKRAKELQDKIDEAEKEIRKKIGVGGKIKKYLSQARTALAQDKITEADRQAREIIKLESGNSEAQSIIKQIEYKINKFHQDEQNEFAEAEESRRQQPANAALVKAKYEDYLGFIQKYRRYPKTSSIENNSEKANEIIKWYKQIYRSGYYTITLRSLGINLNEINPQQWEIKDKVRFKRLLDESREGRGYSVKVYLGMNKTGKWTIAQADKVTRGGKTQKEGSGWYYIKPAKNLDNVYGVNFEREQLKVPWKLNEPICFRVRLIYWELGNQVPKEFMDFDIDFGDRGINMLDYSQKSYTTRLNALYSPAPGIDLFFETNLKPIE